MEVCYLVVKTFKSPIIQEEPDLSLHIEQSIKGSQCRLLNGSVLGKHFITSDHGIGIQRIKSILAF
jgi:hypothetical protein